MKRGNFTGFTESQIAKLKNPTHRTIIKLRREGWKMHKIADFMGTTTGNVCAWTHRAARYLDQIKKLETEPIHCKIKVVKH